jgi:hypothetical protein
MGWVDKYGPTLRIVVQRKGPGEEVADEGADQANSNAQGSQGSSFSCWGLFEGKKVGELRVVDFAS